MGDADKRQATRADFMWRSKKARRRQILLLPLLAALLAPIAGFLWFAFTPPAVQAKPPLAPVAQAPALTLRIGGSIMLAGQMAENITANGVGFPFFKVADFFSATDLSFAGLVSPMADTGSPLPGKPATWRADISAVESLVQSNISLLGLASPHMMDYDTPALLQTIELLSGANIAYMGAGENETSAQKPYILAENGLRVAVLNFCENADIYYSNEYPRALAAGATLAGVASLREDILLAAVTEASRSNDAVILYLSWGDENSYLPRQSQQELAHKLINAGADVIIGNRPHTLQGVEIYDNGLIFYSLGLLAAPVENRQQQEAALLELELSALGWKNARLYPLLLSSAGQPDLATAQDAADIRERIRSISAGFGATLTVEGEALKISR